MRTAVVPQSPDPEREIGEETGINGVRQRRLTVVYVVAGPHEEVARLASKVDGDERIVGCVPDRDRG